jgi:putative transposase
MPCPRKRASQFRYFNSSPEAIRLVVLVYVRFPLSLRNVEDLLFERGIDICHETVRRWWNRFDPLFAGDIRRQHVCRLRGFQQRRWHLEEMYVKLNGQMVYLWRAVDHQSEILESYITKHRDKKAALRFMKKALKRHGSPDKITTDVLRSYGAAMDELGCRERQEVGRWANNRVENSHLPFRRRERAMLRFRQMKTLQKFASVHANIHNHFSLERPLADRQTYKERRSAALAECRPKLSPLFKDLSATRWDRLAIY